MEQIPSAQITSDHLSTDLENIVVDDDCETLLHEDVVGDVVEVLDFDVESGNECW